MTNRVLTQRLRLDKGINFLSVFGLLTLCYALAMPDRHLLLTNYLKLLTHQTYLVHDFFEVAGLSATFFNLSLHFFVAYALNARNYLSHLTGLQLASTGMFVGHALLGTHLLNIAPILLGVILYAKWSGQSFKLYTSLSLFATCTAPTVSLIIFGQGLSLGSLILGLAVGIFLGFIGPPLAEEYLKFHQGYSLYNFGFTAGIISLFSFALVRYFKIPLPKVSLISQRAHGHLNIYLLSLVLIILILGLLGLDFSVAKERYPKLLRRVGRLPDDFVLKYGINLALVNMGLLGLTFLGLLALFQVTLNGPTAGAFLTLVGFGAFGKHLRNTLPIAAGVALAVYLTGQPFDSLSFTLPFLFGTTLAPLAGYYGAMIGVLAGFLQYNIAQIVISNHSGLSLYNNGFSAGFIAAFLVPIINSIKNRFLKDKNSLD